MKTDWYEVLNDFANTHTLAKHVNINIDEGHTSLTAKNETVGPKYEDCNLLVEIMRGAENFVYYLRRNGYVLKRKGRKK